MITHEDEYFNNYLLTYSRDDHNFIHSHPSRTLSNNSPVDNAYNGEYRLSSISSVNLSLLYLLLRLPIWFIPSIIYLVMMKPT